MKTIKRPFAVTSLVALVLTITATQLMRAWATVSNFVFYSEQLGNGLSIFLTLSGLGWGVLGLSLGFGVWRGRAWALRAARWGFIAFATFGWLDRLVLQASGPQTVNWLFQLVVTIVMLAAVLALSALPQTQDFFGEKHERTLKTRRTE